MLTTITADFILYTQIRACTSHTNMLFFFSFLQFSINFARLSGLDRKVLMKCAMKVSLTNLFRYFLFREKKIIKKMNKITYWIIETLKLVRIFEKYRLIQYIESCVVGIDKYYFVFLFIFTSQKDLFVRIFKVNYLKL